MNQFMKIMGYFAGISHMHLETLRRTQNLCQSSSFLMNTAPPSLLNNKKHVPLCKSTDCLINLLAMNLDI